MLSLHVVVSFTRRGQRGLDAGGFLRGSVAYGLSMGLRCAEPKKTANSEFMRCVFLTDAIADYSQIR